MQPLPNLTRIVFWEPCTSPHKADFLSALASQAPNIEFIYCADTQLSNERKAQGWVVNTSANYCTIVAPSKEDIEQLVSDQPNRTLHIFSGIRWVHCIVAALTLVKKYKAHFAIMSEPRVREGWRGTLRFAQSWLTEGWLRRNTAFVLAIGKNGPPWFSSVGYRNESIFPFAYFIDPPVSHELADKLSPTTDQPIQIGYVGRLVKMKGLFDLVAAVAKLGASVQLNIVGTGSDENSLKDTCKELQINTQFLGVLPIHDVGIFMEKMNVIVLASTSSDDGWGVVISEALMSGTAVIATPCVGASILLDEQLFGRCVPANSPETIANAIKELQDSGAFTIDACKKRQQLAIALLSADAGAKHLLEIIKWKFGTGIRPAPFYKTENSHK